MNTAAKVQRRGLPRRPGGESWPDVDGVAAVGAAPAKKPDAPAMDAVELPAHQPAAAAPAGSHQFPPSAGPVTATSAPLRRGLPRSPDGEPWPAVSPAASTVAAATETEVPAVESAVEAGTQSQTLQGSGDVRTETQRIRQGLPRMAGAGSWPLASEVSVQKATLSAQSAADPAPVPDASAYSAAPTGLDAPSMESVAKSSVEPMAESSPTSGSGPAEPAVGTPSTPAERGSSTAQRTPRLPKRWARLGLAAAALVVFAAAAVGISRWFLGSDRGVSFLEAYPGEYHLPEGAPVGLPAWLGWQHFMNVFLMVLIIRSGLQIRKEKRPAAYWTPKGRNGAKVSLTVWFHQSLDLLWLVNGAVFIVLLFATGQWMRVIPTSWEVFPNAASAGLQYMSLDWPTDNGWVNYNSLQQLAYFATIFIAAPLAAATGFRMSGLWPKTAPRLSRWFPIEAARKVHFPVMLYFVAFIAVHVILVFATGALRNLNHMYAAQGSTDPAVYASNWAGFWLFVLSLAVIGAAVAASRPFILAPAASLFGKVSSR